MLITDLLEDLQRHGKEEIEFCLFDENGDYQHLDLFITMGKYLYKKKDKDGNDENTLVLGLEKVKIA
jgi:hypothetical protein